MHRDGADARLLLRCVRCARRCACAGSTPVRIFTVTGTSTAATTASRMRPTSASSPSSAEPHRLAADLLRRAAHVDVDDLRAEVRRCMRAASASCADRCRRAARRAARARPRGPCAGATWRVCHSRWSAVIISARRERRAEAAAQDAERPVGDAGHGREQRPAGERVGTDLRSSSGGGGGRLVAGAAQPPAGRAGRRRARSSTACRPRDRARATCRIQALVGGDAGVAGRRFQVVLSARGRASPGACRSGPEQRQRGSWAAAALARPRFCTDSAHA